MHYSDQAIVEGIRQKDGGVLKYIYAQCFPSVSYLVRSNSGNEDDVQDVFQDAMVILYKNISEGNFELHCSFQTYLYSVCKRLWMKKLQAKQKQEVSLSNFAATVELSEINLIAIYDVEEEKFRAYQKHFLRLPVECQKLLRLFVSKVSLRDIAAQMGFKSEKYAKLRKFLCKEELKRNVLNDPECKQFF